MALTVISTLLFGSPRYAHQLAVEVVETIRVDPRCSAPSWGGSSRDRSGPPWSAADPFVDEDREDPGEKQPACQPSRESLEPGRIAHVENGREGGQTTSSVAPVDDVARAVRADEEGVASGQRMPVILEDASIALVEVGGDLNQVGDHPDPTAWWQRHRGQQQGGAVEVREAQPAVECHDVAARREVGELVPLLGQGRLGIPTLRSRASGSTHHPPRLQTSTVYPSISRRE